MFVYADVSDEKDAKTKVGIDPSRFDRPDLVHVGYAQTSGAGLSWVTHVLETPDGSAYVTACHASHMKFDAFMCSTLLEDGSLVETSMVPPFGHWWHLMSVFEHPARKAYNAFAFTHSIERLVAKHRAVVARVVARNKSAIVPSGGMRGYFAIRLRGRALSDARLPLHERMTFGLTLAVFVAMLAYTFAIAHWDPLWNIRIHQAAVATLYVMVLCAIVLRPTMWIVCTYPAAFVTSLLTRGPAPVPPAILLERASKVRRGWIRPLKTSEVTAAARSGRRLARR